MAVGNAPLGSAKLVGGLCRHERLPIVPSHAPAAREVHEAAVADVGNPDGSVRLWHRVVRLVEVPARAAANVVVADLPQDGSCRSVDRGHGLTAFGVGDDGLPVRGVEGVIRRAERHREMLPRPREHPVHGTARVDLDDPAVAAIGDQQLAGERHARRQRGQGERRTGQAARAGVGRWRRGGGWRCGRRDPAPPASRFVVATGAAAGEHPTIVKSSAVRSQRPLGMIMRRTFLTIGT